MLSDEDRSDLRVGACVFRCEPYCHNPQSLRIGALMERLAAIEKDGQGVGDGWRLLTNEEVFDIWHEAYGEWPTIERPSLTAIPWLEIQAAVLKKNLPAAPGAATPGPADERLYTEAQIADACVMAEIPDSKCESLLIYLDQDARSLPVAQEPKP